MVSLSSFRFSWLAPLVISLTRILRLASIIFIVASFLTNQARAQVVVDQNLQELNPKPVKKIQKSNDTNNTLRTNPPKVKTFVAPVANFDENFANDQTPANPAKQNNADDYTRGRQGFTLYPLGGILLPVRPLKITNYTDDDDGSDNTAADQIAYNKKLFANRGSAELKGNLGYGGGLGFAYDFGGVGLSLNGYAAYMLQTASWSMDTSTDSYISNIVNPGILKQGWDLKSNNIIAAIGLYYNIFLGDTMSIGVGGDAGINYVLATLTYNSQHRVVVTPAGGATDSGLSNTAQTAKISGVQYFVAPRINIDFYIPLYQMGAARPTLSALIINLYASYYYPFNASKFSFDPNARDSNGRPSGTTRTGEIQGIGEGIVAGIGLGLQF